MPDSKGKKLADMMFGKPEQKPAGGDYIRPTPQNAALGAAANLLKKAYAPERTQQAQGAAEFLGIPAVARTLERLSYGEPLTTGKGMTLKPKEDTVEALLSVAPLAPATKGMPVGMMFIGPNAKTWDKAAATAFERLEKAGVDPVEIWRQTGTFRGADGILRQEISDVGAQFRNANEIKELAKTKKFQAEALKEQIKGVPGQKDLFPKALTEARRPAREQVKQLKEEADALSLDPSYRGQPAKFVLEHPELYKAYPELANINVTQGGRSGGEGTLAALSGGKGGMEMEVTQRGLRYEPRSSLLHEMQHAVQTLEDMAPGGNTAMAFKDPRAFEILTRMRADAAKPMSLEEYSKHFFGMNPTKNLADADPELLKQGYESYLKGIPAAVKKIDIDLQKQAAMEYYKRLAGEAEARATQFREPMGMGERRQEFPYSSYDVPAEDLIVKSPKGQQFQQSIDLDQLRSGGIEVPASGFTKEEKAKLRPLYNQGLIRVEERDGKQVLVPGRGAWYEFATPEQRSILDAFQESQGVRDLSLMSPTESLLTSAQSSFYDFEIVPGVRNVPIKNLEPFLPGYDSGKEAKRIEDLAGQIRESKQIEPLFIGLDPTGEAYIMEGQHRIRALKSLGYDEVPARIVVDMDDVAKAAGGKVSFSESPDAMKLELAKGGAVKMDKGGAAFGVFPQMKPRRSKQDPEAAKDVPRQLLRGWAAGTLGLPGDIEGLIRMLPGLDETPRLPTSEFYLDYLPGKAEGESGKAAAGLGTLFGGLGSTKIARGALEAGKGAQRLAERAAAMPSPSGLAAQRGVVKMPGGNWLTGSVEKGVAPLKANRPNADEELRKARELFTPEYKSGMSPEAVARLENETLPRLEKEVALNKWIDSNLTNYIKKQMATPDDPVRKLAEEGISHRPLTPYSYETAAKAGKKREVAGGGRYGKSQLAKQWEDESDVALNTPTVGQISLPIVVERNPWLKKLDPNERVYAVDNASELGFDHIVDVLREDLAAGRIRPEQLNKVSMEQAVRRTYEYDQELAKKMQEANAALRAGLPVYKEYPEKFRWIELNKPGSFASESEAMGHSVRGYEPPKGHPDWTPESGESGSLGYGHGGWEAIKSGKAKVYSLVDEKGQPHVTMEVGRGRLDPASVREKYPEAYAEYAANRNKYFNNISEYLAKERPDILAEAPQEITQIKGKQNAAPKEEYLPFVQDFVRSGQWSDVGDFQNTGLVRIDPESDLAAKMKSMGQEPPPYVSQDELTGLLHQYLIPKEGMKRGGKVSFSDNPDTMKLELAGGGAVKALKALVKGEKKAAVPIDIPRVRPTQQDIIEAAERVGRQQLGEHVTNPLTAPANLAGRAVKEAKRLKDLEYKLKPAKPLPKEEVYQPKIGEVNIALPGDQTIADMILESIGDVEIGSLQQGGAKYGLGRLSDPEAYRAFWASNQGAAQNFQNKVDEIARQFDTDQVTAQHLAMGLTSNDFAQHFADANIRAIDYSKMNKRQMEIFDSHIAAGYTKKNPKTGEKEQISFPEWPGISNPEAALEAMKNNSELRKWFNNRMKTQDLTAATNMPDGRAIQWAITEPLIRNSEINLTGLSVGRMKPGAELIPNAPHETYSHDIAGTALGRAPELAPFEISFPDVTSFVREKYRPQDFTGTIQKVFPHQIVDEAYLEDMQKYYEQLRKVRGFKKGGAVKKAEFSDNPDTMRLELMKAKG